MKGWEKKFSREKHLFRSYYCQECKQRKSCRTLTSENKDWQSYCCLCYFQQVVKRTQEYLSWEKILAEKHAEQKSRIKQLKLLRNYQGCNKCSSYAVDAYDLLEENKLICQPCLAKKTGGSASPISFAEQSQWYQKRWGINLREWLDTYDCLPINANCAKKWLKDSNHLSNCACLEIEAKEIHELFANSLREKGEKLKKCSCKTSEKVRIGDDDYAWCEKCDKTIAVASKKRVIKNRNDPKFWGLEIKEKVLCGECLEKQKREMTPLRRAEFNRYRKVGRL
jgi:hypothetical protein